MKIDLDCPHCKANIVKSYGDTVKMRSKLLKWDQGGMYAVCKSCSGEVAITLDLMKSIQAKFIYEVNTKIEKSTCID